MTNVQVEFKNGESKDYKSAHFLDEWVKCKISVGQADYINKDEIKFISGNSANIYE